MSTSIFSKFPCLTEDLSGPRSPNRCQACGRRRFAIEGDGGYLETWIECDDFDRPSSRILKLCTFCDRVDKHGRPLIPAKYGKDGVIHRHARLYNQPVHNAPLIGAMPLCQACVHRHELTCTNPNSLANGGEGIRIHVGPVGFIDFARGGGEMIHATPPSKCEGFKQKPEDPETDDDKEVAPATQETAQ